MRNGRQRHREPVSKALLSALVITVVFFGIEVVAGVLTHSLALLADAGHMATDAAVLLVSLGARWYSLRPAPAARSWGYHRVEVLAALGSGVLLVLLVASIYWEAVQRLGAPPHVKSLPMLLVAAAGLGANGVAGLLLFRERKVSISAQGAFANVVADALASIGVIIGSVVMLTTRWYLADPIVSMAIGLLILSTAWRLLRTTTDILLETTPRHIDLQQLHQAILNMGGVQNAHDLHVWTLTTGFVAMSGHVVLERPDQDIPSQQQLLMGLRDHLKEEFGIDHVTVQVEASSLPGEETHCEGEPVCLA